MPSNKSKRCRVNKTDNFTIVSSLLLRSKEISLKSLGLLLSVLSFPDDWDYSVAGLVFICKEGKTAIDSALKELKNIGYLVVTKLYANMTASKGIEYVYDFFENPISEDEADKHREKVKAEAKAKVSGAELSTEMLKTADFSAPQEGEKQGVENLYLDDLPLEVLPTENRPQYNTKEQNKENKILSDEGSINQSAVSGEKTVENVERTKGRLIDGYITDKEKIKNIIKENIEYDEYVEWIELFGSDTMTVSGLDQIVSHMVRTAVSRRGRVIDDIVYSAQEVQDSLLRVNRACLDRGYDVMKKTMGMNGTPAFLLMKQAIATGWDCPRAKILVKLREGGDESFQIQTIGRIRRMPERKHYMFCYTLNNCYIYTLDSTYKNDLLSQLDKAYQVRRLFVKDIVHDFSLTKEMRNLDVDSGLDEKELLKKIHKHFVDKYCITTRTVENQQILERNDYNFSHEIDSRILHGEFHSTGELSNAAPSKTMAIKTTINTHTHGIYLQHVADEIKKITTIPTARVKKILRRLFFRSKKQKNYRITSLYNQDFYAFVINNASRLKKEFREIMADSEGVQLTFGELAKTSKFTIPESDLFKFGVVKDVKLMSKNVYKDYTTEFVSSDTRKSKPERLFERYCETADSVEWIYKNGDTGQDYLSIVYKDNLNKQWLFYPDYIIKLTNGEVWIIEAKGGEQDGHTKNIDMKVEQKFAALKAYAERYKVNWGFVRDIDEDLYFCNTEYTEDMSSDNWKILSSVLK